MNGEPTTSLTRSVAGMNLAGAHDHEQPAFVESTGLPTIEFAVFQVKPWVTPFTVGTDGWRVMRDTMMTMYEQEGCQSVYAGLEVGSSTMVHLCVVWDSLEDHMEFMQSPGYGDFARKFLPYITGAGTIIHGDIEPFTDAHKALSAPLTVIRTCYFEGDPPDDYEEGFAKLRKHFGTVPGFISAAAGTTSEEMECNGFHGKATMYVTGWESEEAYAAYCQTSANHLVERMLKESTEKMEVCQLKLNKLAR